MTQGISRRRFLELASASLAGVLGFSLVGCEAGAGDLTGTVRRSVPSSGASTAPGSTAGLLEIAPASQLTTTPKAVSVNVGNGTVYAFLNNGQPTVLSSVCTHQGCQVGWDGSEFACPCHGGTYDRSGQVTGGPPPQPLASYTVKEQNGTVYIQA